MGKETKDTRQDKSGGDSLEDGLDKASEQAAHLSDIALARLFIEANEEAKELDTPPFRELFVEEKKVHHIEEAAPDPKFLEEIYDSLERKEIHHKKLLEENVPSNRLLKLIHNLKEAIKLPTSTKDVVVTPTN